MEFSTHNAHLMKFTLISLTDINVDILAKGSDPTKTKVNSGSMPVQRRRFTFITYDYTRISGGAVFLGCDKTTSFSGSEGRIVRCERGTTSF